MIRKLKSSVGFFASPTILLLIAAAPQISRADSFINISPTVTGSVSASGVPFGQSPALPVQTANLTTTNQNISVGVAGEVTAAAADTFASSPTSLSAGVTTNQSYGNYIPTATESATQTITFQVPTTGLYQLNGTVSDTIATSIAHASMVATTSLVGLQGTTTVFSAEQNSIGWDIPTGSATGVSNGLGGFANPIQTQLLSGAVYTLTVVTSDDGYTTNNPGLPYFLADDPGSTEAQLTITPVPEPTTALLCTVAFASLANRRRRIQK